MSSHLSAFVAANLREPNAQELADILKRDLEDRRQRDAERHEKTLQRAYMNQPGATESGWTAEKNRILAEDRAERTVKQRDAARAQMARSYRRSF